MSMARHQLILSSANNPAGWGVVVVENPTKNHDGGKILAAEAGPVVTDDDDLDHLGVKSDLITQEN